jgi:5-enolpyruvylshikimate-3-phosphate synthase
MKCKVFLKQQHAQWKSLGSAKLKLYRQEPTNVKQLVVEADSSSAKVLISTIVLTDGVERVGKTGVAIELSDRGQRTGIVYMIQLRNEKSAGGLFDELLVGSDRGR